MPTQSDKQGALLSGPASTMRATSMVLLHKQGVQLALTLAMAQGTPIWHLWTSKPLRCSTTATTITSSTKRGSSTRTNSCSVADPPTPLSKLTTATLANSTRTSLLPWLRWETSSPSLDLMVRLGRIAGRLTKLIGMWIWCKQQGRVLWFGS